ncbi:MAG: YbaN family protein [Peptococcaceae bacterium]|nr:YbaN family protein [Peptococcaceae bacterium]
MNIKNILLLGAGFLLLGMGAVGVLLPVWPTTPFVLAAAGCFASHPKLHQRMMRLPFFSEYIRNYQEKRGLPKKTVAVSLVFLWGMLLISALCIRKPWVLCILALVGAGVTVHILWISKARKR